MERNNKISLYWKCQLIGWCIASLYWGYIGFTGAHFNWFIGLLQFISDVAVYIGITHLYRLFALRHGWQHLQLGPLLKRLVPAVLVMGVFYAVVTILKIWTLRQLFHFGGAETFSVFLENKLQSIFIAGIRLMSIWLLAYHLYQYAQREIRVVRENSRLELANRDASLAHLSAQLQPHFLFNAMNTIKSLVAEDPSSARHAIDLLSSLLRSGLVEEATLVPLSREMELVRDYLDLEKLRFEDRLDIRIDIDPLAMDIKIPRLAIQTLIENALKHGISTLKDGGTVAVKIQRTNNLVIVVSSPGILQADYATRGVGLKNLSERLRLTYSEKASLKITETEMGLVTVILIIPLI